jgi:hypothetical protein
MHVKTNSSALSQVVEARPAFFRTGIFPRAQRFRHRLPTPGACVVDRVAARISLEGRSPHRLLALWGLLRLRQLSEALDTVQVHHQARRIFSRALSASSSVAFVTGRVTRLRRTSRISLNLISQCRLDILGCGNQLVGRALCELLT